MQNLILLPLYKNYRILFGWFCEVYHVVKCKLNMRLLCSVLFESCMTVFMATGRHSECLILMYPVAIVFETPLDSVCLILVEGSGENYFIFLVMFCMHDGPPPLSYHIGQGVLEPGCMDKYLIGTCVGVLTGYQGFCEGSYSVVIIYVWIKMIIIIFMLILKLMLLVLGFVMVHCYFDEMKLWYRSVCFCFQNNGKDFWDFWEWRRWLIRLSRTEHMCGDTWKIGPKLLFIQYYFLFVIHLFFVY